MLFFDDVVVDVGNVFGLVGVCVGAVIGVVNINCRGVDAVIVDDVEIDVVVDVDAFVVGVDVVGIDVVDRVAADVGDFVVGGVVIADVAADVDFC